jgi:hypothetical protein
MKVGDQISVSGFITKEKFIAGRTLAEAERIPGFHAGRFSHGAAIAILMELPDMQHFKLGAYSNVAAQNYQTPSGLDLDKLKATARVTWATTGFERLRQSDFSVGTRPQYETGYPIPSRPGSTSVGSGL